MFGQVLFIGLKTLNMWVFEVNLSVSKEHDQDGQYSQTIDVKALKIKYALFVLVIGRGGVDQCREVFEVEERDWRGNGC